ncbi:type IV pilus secretin PilQ [Pelagibacterales bacterium SAG-MED01]|nr:type IV pilus secretin PilQ [Pelagibacterales bacterium SAG-MED01]
MNRYFKIFITLSFIVLLQSCATSGKKPKSVHGDKPLIDTAQIIVEGRADMDKKIIDGPKPYDTNIPREDKRKTITTENVKNYVYISDEYTNLKQMIDINFQGLDFKYVMSLMADIADINILIGDEVSGTVNAKIENVGWDVAFQTLLDMKTLVADVDTNNGIIRVHTPEKLTAQETAKSARAEVLKKKIQLEESVEPILAEIFRLYYISPSQAKTTLEALFATQGAEGASTMSNLSITVEDTTRSIIVRGHEPDLDTIDAVIREIDVKTKQVLIEAFIIDATSTFAKALGARVGAMSVSDRIGEGKGTTTISGMTSGGNAAATAGDIALGSAAGTISNQGISGTSGIGILRQIGARALKVEIEALESLGLSKTLSQPSVFTLNNQEATITQGTQIAYQTTADGTTTTEFKEAALSLTVTPSIIGDGNVLLDIQVNNDSPVTVAGSDEPGIKTNSIVTKLLVSDGDIVVIGGIKKNTTNNTNSKTPGVSKVPVIGNLFKSKNNSDELVELLIFIAPRVIE